MLKKDKLEYRFDLKDIRHLVQFYEFDLLASIKLVISCLYFYFDVVSDFWVAILLWSEGQVNLSLIGFGLIGFPIVFRVGMHCYEFMTHKVQNKEPVVNKICAKCSEAIDGYMVCCYKCLLCNRNPSFNNCVYCQSCVE